MKMHIGALVCFLLATVFYLSASLPGAIGLGILGVVFELAAWVLVLKSERTRAPSSITGDTLPQTTDLPIGSHRGRPDGPN